jgi:hypothetical protein
MHKRDQKILVTTPEEITLETKEELLGKLLDYQLLMTDSTLVRYLGTQQLFIRFNGVWPDA